jgi:branched-chain amino acid transport system substrate-binding protein
VVSGCGADQTDSAAGEIRIGVSIELSGTGAAIGPAHRNALTLVADDINRRGGVLGGQRIKLIIKDNKSDPNQSLQLAKDFVDKDKVAAVIGGGASPTTLSIVDTMEQRKVPLVSMGSSDAIVSPIGQRKFVFKTPPNPGPVMDVMLREFKAHGISRVGLLAVGDAYGDSGVKAVREGTDREAVTLVGVERFAPGDRDYTAQLTKLIEQRPDALVVWSIMPWAGHAARNIQDLGFTGRTYFDSGAGAEQFVKDANAASEGMYMVHPTVLAANQITATTPSALAQKEFFTRYTQKYGTFSGFASYSADALNLIVTAIEQAGTTDHQKVRDALEKLSYDGLTGSFQFGPANHGGVSGDALTVLTVRNGGWVVAQ